MLYCEDMSLDKKTLKGAEIQATPNVSPSTKSTNVTGAIVKQVDTDLGKLLTANVYRRSFFSERVLPRPEEVTKNPPDPAIKLSKYAETHFRSPKSAQEIVEAARDPQGKFIRPSGYYSYTDHDADKGTPEVDTGTAIKTCEVLKDWLQKEYGSEIDLEWMVLCTSAAGAVDVLADCQRENDTRPTKVATISPTFHRFITHGQKHDGLIPLKEDRNSGWKLDIARLTSTLQNGKFTHFVLTNPNNPTGTVYSPKDLRTIVSLCKKYNVTLISDEVWCDLVLDEKTRFTPALVAAKKHKYQGGTATIYSGGKTFNTSGFPCTVAIIPDPHIRQAFREKTQRPTALACEVTMACLRDGKAYLSALKPYLRKNVARTARALNAAGFPTPIPQASYMLFAKVGEKNAAGKERLKNAGIGTHHKSFGDDDYERITVGEPYDIVNECCKNLQRQKY